MNNHTHAEDAWSNMVKGDFTQALTEINHLLFSTHVNELYIMACRLTFVFYIYQTQFPVID